VAVAEVPVSSDAKAPAIKNTVTKNTATKNKAADPKTAEQLLNQFRTMPGLEAKFEEIKKLKLLASPLVSQGRIYFMPPSTLLRRVETPETEEILVTRSLVRRRRAAGEEIIDLGAHREIRPLVESILWVFAGDYRALSEVYQIRFSRNEATPVKWRLLLIPKKEPLKHMVAQLAIDGQGFSATQIEVRETQGDVTLTRILEANPQRRFTAQERGRLFGVKQRELTR